MKKRLLYIALAFMLCLPIVYWYSNRLYEKEDHCVKVSYDSTSDSIVIENTLKDTRFLKVYAINGVIPTSVLPEKYHKPIEGSTCFTYENNNDKNLVITDRIQLSGIKANLKDGVYDLGVDLVDTDVWKPNPENMHEDGFILEKSGDRVIIKVRLGRSHSKGEVYNIDEYRI